MSMKPDPQFVKDLPKHHKCERCGVDMILQAWQFSTAPEGDFAINICHCQCGALAIAAAGSTLAAQRIAQAVRLRLLSGIEPAPKG